MAHDKHDKQNDKHDKHDKQIDWFLRERNYLRKFGLHLDISPICSRFILIVVEL